MAKFEFNNNNWQYYLREAVDIAIIILSAMLLLLTFVAVVKGCFWIIFNF